MEERRRRETPRRLIMKEGLNSVKTKGFALAEQKRAKASHLGSLAAFEKKRKFASLAL
jgi:hypothetical protein